MNFRYVKMFTDFELDNNIFVASQGAFPNTSMELKLVKKSWKLVNAESGVTSLALSPSIVTIVSKLFLSRFILL
jgi:hypothetical protein